MPQPTSRTPHLRSVERALTILSAVYLSDHGARLADVKALTGIGKSTAHRILSTLVCEGIVRRDADTGSYAPDLSAWLYVMPSVAPGLALVAGIQSALDALTAATGLTSVIVLPIPGGGATYAALWSVPDAPLHYDPANAPRSAPLHASSSGKCLLAALPPEEQDRYLAQPLARLTPQTITSPAKLRKELARARELGYALHSSELTPGVSSIGALLQAPEGPILGGVALGLPHPDAAGEVSATLPHLQAAQRRIEELLSYEAWLQLVRHHPSPTPLLPSPWDTLDAGFGNSPVLLVRTVSHMVRLMATLLRHPEGASVRSVARERGMDKTSTWRLLHTLSSAGIAWQDASGERFRISPGYLVRHARIMRAATSLTHVVDRVLGDLASHAGATAMLVVPDRELRRAVICRFSLPSSPICFHPEHAPFAHLHATASGKVYLAAQSKPVIQEYLRRGLPALTDSSIATREDLLRELEGIRRAGYALSREECASSVGGCAVLVEDFAGKAVAGLCVVPPIMELDPAHIARWVPLLRQAAQALSPLLVEDWQERLEAETATAT